MRSKLSTVPVHSMASGDVSSTFNRDVWPAAKIRDTFIQYFEQRGHVHCRSSPVVPLDDPTLLFANAGMNQFKPLFLGIADPSGPLASLTRATNSQKCIRAGGKHNDLDDVGKDTYHHTFFEMLGNWSFGDYFKAEAIQMAFELLTSVYGLPKDRLYATYFGGDESMGLPEDSDARDFWLEVLPSSRVLPFGKKDNFWEMGDTGPCGPCTELHFDRIGGRDAASLVNMDDASVIEIWNLVFIQYNREQDGSLRPLPNKHVDTGMGFERIASILQGAMSNYDTDVFQPIFDAIKATTGCRDYSGLLGDNDKDGIDMAYRVVADHIRTLTIAITDGAVPSAEGRGYVLRRILRRAVRYGRQFLHAPPGFFAGLTDSVVESMGGFFPELVDKREYVKNIVAHEEATFARTLDKGTEKFTAVVQSLRSKGETVVSGADAFFLYDTMGFPLDLTQRMAEEQKLTVDEHGYRVAMTAARNISRADRDARAGLGTGSRIVLEAEETNWLADHRVSPTYDEHKYIWHHKPVAKVMALFLGRSAGGFVDCTKGIPNGTAIGVITDATSFYAESGGQVSDIGVLLDADDKSSPIFEVKSCQVAGGFVMHLGVIDAVNDSRPMKVGMTVLTSVDYTFRSKVAPNHTMTHVLNHALREELGDGVDQKGSLVDAMKLRFDISQNKALTLSQLTNVERRCCDNIEKGETVYTTVTPLADAMEINGLRAVFGETYPDPVRVVSIGVPVEALLDDPKNEAWRAVSVEFCGGTHLKSTSEAEAFVLVEESALATGIRRLVALTGDAAKNSLSVAKSLTERVAAAKNQDVSNLGAEVTALTSLLNEASISAVQKAELRDQIAALSKKANAASKQLAKEAQAASLESARKEVSLANEEGKSRCIVKVALGGDGKALAKLVAEMSKTWPDGSIMALSVDEAKMSLRVCTCSRTVAANKWASDTLAVIGGKGGGKPDSGSGSAKLDSLDQVASVMSFAEQWTG